MKETFRCRSLADVLANDYRPPTKDGDQRNTPQPLVKLLREVAPIGLDPCSNPGSIVDAWINYRLDQGEDGLIKSWNLGFRVPTITLVNGPWSWLLPWVLKAREEFLRGGVCTAFISRPESATEWARSLHVTASRFAELTTRQAFHSRIAAEHQGNDVAATRVSFIGDPAMAKKFTDCFREAGHHVLRAA